MGEGPDLLPPAVRHRLRGLRLRARRARGGRGVGLHASPSRGAGLEFAQHRAYEPGDDPRSVDWRLYARSDRVFVREAEREGPLTLWILLDASGSMGQPDGRGGARMDAARALAMGLAELALAGGDRFGLVVLGGDGGGLRLLPPAAEGRQRDRLALELRATAPGGTFPPPPRWAPLWDRVGRRDLAVLLSDGFDPLALDLARRLAGAGREVAAVRLLTPEERDFPFQGGHRFRDPETGEELLGDGAALRADFLRRFGEARAEADAALDAAGVRHVEHVTDAPLDAPLRALFGAPGA